MTILDQVRGRINDVDSHEMIPTPLWRAQFGEQSALFATMLRATGRQMDLVTDLTEDSADLDERTIWYTKGPRAPGAIDLDRRRAMMDVTGVANQLLFPSGPGLFGAILATAPQDMVQHHFAKRFLHYPDDLCSFGEQLIYEYNDWCLRVATPATDRVRPVAVVPTSSVDTAIAEAERLIDGGVRAVMLPVAVPPGGVSPAHPDVDPLWRVFAEANVPVLLHIGGEIGFLARQREWADSPMFVRVGQSDEIAFDRYTFSIAHLAVQNYLSTMIIGAVFDRHPTLRVGAIESTAHWVGPMAENIEMWMRQVRPGAGIELELTPGEYFERNIRVSGFWWEPIDRYIDRYGMDSVYCYASDFPHYEGGTSPMETFSGRIERLGSSVGERFFVTNAELLIPAA